jgi:hypothetical protein
MAFSFIDWCHRFGDNLYPVDGNNVLLKTMVFTNLECPTFYETVIFILTASINTLEKLRIVLK